MAYVRQRGKQLAIVHGERDPTTGKVEQRVLFTIHSRAEARELLGKNGQGGEQRFRSFMDLAYPELRLDWKAIHAGVRELLELLPESYEYEGTRLVDQFRAGLVAFTRQLAVADGWWLSSAARLLRSQRRELAFVRDLIDWRLEACEERQADDGEDDPFFWRYALRGREVPEGVEEIAAELYERGRLDDAEPIFRLLTEAFEGYAEGHNYLGLIALARGDLGAAAAEFRRTIELGRRGFPRRLAKKGYQDELSTRPYLRGLRNLSLTLARAGEHEEALALCDRLERECGDDLTADARRATISLNVGRWQEALTAADRLHRLYPEQNLFAALAAFELGRKDEARWRFLHGALNQPRTARMLLGLRTTAPDPRRRDEVEDHNAGVDGLQDLRPFLGRRAGGWKRFFRAMLREPEVGALLAEKEAVVRRWSGPHEPQAEWRAAFDRLQLMNSPGFAREQAGFVSQDRHRGSAGRKTADETPTVPEKRSAQVTKKPTETARARASYHVLKVTLAEVDPPVWRRLVISGDRTLKRLNFALQAAMGWTHSHLHMFELKNGERYSDPVFELDDCEDEGRARIKAVLPRVGSRLRFQYDFGDCWWHDVVVEQITTKAQAREPFCFDGEGAGPPEDVGGPPGYEEFQVALAHPEHERHEELLDWSGYEPGEFDPSRVDLDEINRRLARPPRLGR